MTIRFFIPRCFALMAALFMTATVLMTSTGHAETPPVNCHRMKSGVARTICASPELKAMDREISALNDRGMAALNPNDQRRLALTQLAFFRHRNSCEWASHHSAHPGAAVDECVRADMETRLQLLRAVIDRGGFAQR